MTGQVHTLIVDDEPVLRQTMAAILQRAGYQVATASNGEEALAVLRDRPFDLVLLDLRLGGRTDGLRVLEGVRWRWPQTAVIILTAFGTLESAMAAIQEGVEGYLLKPVEHDQLLQAIEQALVRRRHLAAPPDGTVLRLGPFVADLAGHQVTLRDGPLDLTAREFKLLTYLMQNAGRVVSAQDLVQVAQGYRCDDEREARQVAKWYVHRLRKKIEPDPAAPHYLRNVRGVGYILYGPEAAEPSF